MLIPGALVALALISCAESNNQDPGIEPTATFSPADATATWDAFKPELDRLAAVARENQIATIFPCADRGPRTADRAARKNETPQRRHH